VAAAILGDEVVDNQFAELRLKIHHMVADAQMAGHHGGIVGGRAAAGAAGGEQPHGDADHLVSLLLEECGGYGGIHPAAHGNGNLHSSSPRMILMT